MSRSVGLPVLREMRGTLDPGPTHRQANGSEQLLESGASMTILRLAALAGVTGLAIPFAGLAQEKTAPARNSDQVTQGFRAIVVAEPRFEIKDGRNPIPAKDKPGRGPVDLVTDNGLNPVIAVFAREIPADANHPLAAVVKKLDELAEIKEYKARRLAAFLVFLALKDEFRKDPTLDARVKDVAQFAAGVMPKKTTIALAEATETPDDAAMAGVPAQVEAMGIAPEDDIVIVFYYKLNVIKRWKFKAAMPPGEADLKDLEAEVVKLLGATKK